MKIEEITKYKCPKCKKLYDTKEHAEECALPREPKYKVGDILRVTETVGYAAAGSDSFSHDYDYIDEGSVGIVSKVTDENKYWGLNYVHPQPVYGFDIGTGIITWYVVREEHLKRADESDIVKLKNKVNKIDQARKNLENIIEELE
jgi:hypothetical protein